MTAADPAKPAPHALRIADYTYDLPPERIAVHPLAERDAARLLVYRPGQHIADDVFRNLAQHLPAPALLVFNETRVVPARLLFRKGESASGALIELFCLAPAEGDVQTAMSATEGVVWHCLVGNRKRWRGGALQLQVGSLRLTASLRPQSRTDDDSGELVQFSWSPAHLSFAEVLTLAGQVPLPPYLKRPPLPDDVLRYQTVYAQHAGAVAAPTAGLHFTPRVLQDLSATGVDTTYLTLHVGAGTFRPVTAQVMADHEMHGEGIIVSRETVVHLGRHLAEPAPVVAVGTTSMRTLESLYWFGVQLLGGAAPSEMRVGQWAPYEPRQAPDPPAAAAIAAILDWLDLTDATAVRGVTHLMIAPGYRFRICQGLVTNFHQPQSTLLLLIAAFIGADWRRVYDYALANGFRFLSYGDSSLLWRADIAGATGGS